MSETCQSFVNSPEVNASCGDLFSQVTPSPETADEMLPSLNSGIISQSARPNMTQDNQDQLEAFGEPAHSELEPGRKVFVPSDEDCDSNKSMPHTHFLESLISSLNINKSSTEEEVIKLPRSQLTMIIRQTLYMQTLYNFMQGLAQEKWPKQRNFILREKMNEAKNPLLMQIQDTVSERQIFRFDNPLTDLSDQSKPIIIQNVLKSSTDVSHNTADSSCKVGTLETDGESMISMSLQLPSQLNLDGDHPQSENPPGKGESRKVTLSGNTEIATSPEQQFNIPDLDLIEGSQECFQHSSNGSRDSVDNVGISFEEFELMQDELDKSKRYMHVLLHENEHLKETVRTLEEANTVLRERESRFNGANMEQLKPHEHHLAVLVEKVKKMEKNIELKDHAMAILNTKIAILQNENKILKDQVHASSLANKAGPQSQPPSDTGYSALPPIVEPCICCVSQETQTSIRQDEKNIPMLLAELENVRAENKNMQKEIDHLKHTHSQISYGEVEQKKALEKQLKSIKEKLLQYQKKLKENEDHRRELADEITGSYDEIDKEKKKSLIIEDRYRRLEGIMEDERRRFTRDEKLLLDRCDQLDKSNNLLKNLVLILEGGLEGSGLLENLYLTSEQARELANLKSESSPCKIIPSNTNAHSSTRSCLPNPISSQSGKSPGTGTLVDIRPFETSLSKSTPDMHENLSEASVVKSACAPLVLHDAPLPPQKSHHRSLFRQIKLDNRGDSSAAALQASSVQVENVRHDKKKDYSREWLCPYCHIADFESEEKYRRHLQQCSDCH